MPTPVEKALFGFHIGIDKELIHRERHQNMPRVQLSCVSDKSGLDGTRLENSRHLIIHGINNGVVVLPRALRVSVEPIRHIYKDGSLSNALYYVEEPLGQHVYMLAFLPPGKLTSSPHYHLPRNPLGIGEADNSLEFTNHPSGIDEYYEVLYGSGWIHHSAGDLGKPIPDFFKIPPGVTHQLEAGPQGLLVSILMINAALYPHDHRHIR